MSASSAPDATLAAASTAAAAAAPVPSSQERQSHDFRQLGPSGAAAAVRAVTARLDEVVTAELLVPRSFARSPQLASILEVPATRAGALSAWLAPALPALAPALPAPKSPPAALRDAADRSALSSSNQLQAQLLQNLAPALPPPAPTTVPTDLLPEAVWTPYGHMDAPLRLQRDVCWLCGGNHFARECFHSASYVIQAANLTPSPPPPPAPAAAPTDGGDPAITCACAIPAVGQLVAWITSRP